MGTTNLDTLTISGLRIGSGAGVAVDTTAANLNTLAGVTAGVATASKAAVLGTNKNIDELHTAALYLGAAAGTAVTATAAELNTLAGVTAGTATASKAAVLGASKELDLVLGIQTIATADLGTVRPVYGQVTASHEAISAGSIAGVRGLCTLSGTISAGGSYLYGAQGKLVVTGTMNHADARLCGALAQLDISAGTYTTGQLSALWVDAGATASASAIATKGGGQFNLLRISNTTAASSNAVIFAYADADYFLDLGGPGGNADWFDAEVGATANCSGHIKVNLNGTPAYIRVYASAS